MMYPPFAVFTPALAAGAAAAAVAVPLAIHLLFRKRYQVVPWAAMRFLVVAERRHKRRIDQWLLLLLRTAALALLLFAMLATTAWAERLWQAIKPGTTETINNVPRTHHVIVIDTSLSMTAKTEDGQTRFERAVAQAEHLIRSGNPGDGYTLLKMTGTLAEPVVPGPSNDPEKVVAALRAEVKPTHGTADHTAALPVIADIITRSPRAYPRRQLTFISDLQRASWANAVPRPENSTAEVWQRITARADVVVVDTARDDVNNLAVADLALADPMPLVDHPAAVTVTVANLSRTERKNVRVDLLLGRPSGGSDSLVAIGQKAIDAIPPGLRGTVKFDLSGPNGFRDRGIHVLQAKLVEGDDLPADDSRALAVEVRDGIHALLVDGRADPLPERRAATYLNFALFPLHASPGLTPARPRVVTPGEFLDPVCDLTGVDCVFLCDVPNPTSDLAAKLDAVLRRGGTVVIGLGPNAAASRTQYNTVLYREGNGILPGALGDTVTVASPDDLGFQLHADDDEYRKAPLVSFNDDRFRAGLTSVPFQTYMKLDAPPGGRARRIMTFARAGAAAPDPKTAAGAKPDPALVEWGRHRGRVYVFTSTFNEGWNAWPRLPTFPPFWGELLKHCVANPDRHTLRVGEPIEEFFPTSAAGLEAGLSGPDGLTAHIRLELEDEAGVGRFKNTAVSGLYRMGINGSRDRVFAVNVAEIDPARASESDLRRTDRSEFRAPVQVVDDPAEVKPTGESGAVLTTAPKPHGPFLARFATEFALLVLATELLLAWRFGPSRTAAAASAAPRSALAKRLQRLAGTLAALLPWPWPGSSSSRCSTPSAPATRSGSSRTACAPRSKRPRAYPPPPRARAPSGGSTGSPRSSATPPPTGAWW
ncbi:BatA domain-containing protein [Frigoriglobus tundricola]|uniref:Aerotolerance regulator N-terminal domain-containing protein n=1 Tax=Frigoriglobus tundricola TaxID=2774151 RepID=A0A6M5YX38_9BACT|nr:BatA domain-containing protein [Frigoriglobus tundricola]QJW98539.1 hypothetical protein FTUN_6132 [Frigoriglobus tundricola]